MMKVLPFFALVGVASAFTAAGKTYFNYVHSVVRELSIHSMIHSLNVSKNNLISRLDTCSREKRMQRS